MTLTFPVLRHLTLEVSGSPLGISVEWQPDASPILLRYDWQA